MQDPSAVARFLREADLASQRLGRAPDYVGQTQRNTALGDEISQESNQIDVVIRRVLFPHRGSHKMRIPPGTRSAFRDKAKSNALGSL